MTFMIFKVLSHTYLVFHSKPGRWARGAEARQRQD